MSQPINRRSFLKGGLAAALAIAPIAGIAAAVGTIYRQAKNSGKDKTDEAPKS
jgi:anaerobic selenocysteine-containing dehydrogenase